MPSGAAILRGLRLVSFSGVVSFSGNDCGAGGLDCYR